MAVHLPISGNMTLASQMIDPRRPLPEFTNTNGLSSPLTANGPSHDGSPKTPAVKANGADSGQPRRVFFLRHGESEGNVTEKDIPDPLLTQTGLDQAESWEGIMNEFGVELVLVSPLRRAVQTACLAFANENMPMKLCREAREFEWHLKENSILSTPDELRSLLAELPRGDEVTNVDGALTETPSDEEESMEHLRAMLARCPARTVAVVCHGGVMKALTPPDEPWADNAEMLECTWTRDERLVVVERHQAPCCQSSCPCRCNGCPCC